LLHVLAYYLGLVQIKVFTVSVPHIKNSEPRSNYARGHTSSSFFVEKEK